MESLSVTELGSMIIRLLVLLSNKLQILLPEHISSFSLKFLYLKRQYHAKLTQQYIITCKNGQRGVFTLNINQVLILSFMV